MYEARFGLKRRPFPPTPDSSLYYPSTPHEQALAPLLRSVDDDEGLMLLIGEPGTGKTLIGQVFLERLGEKVVNAFVPHGQFANRLALLQAILFDLSLPYDENTEQLLRLRLTAFALKNAAEGKRFVIVVDEAHLLTPELLEELRLLGNLEAGRKAVQIVGLAQPRIQDTLKQPGLATWNQRLGVRMFLPALTLEDSLDYLQQHLRLAGARPDDVIDEAAREAIAQATRGVPRLLNQAAHQSLLLAEAADLHRVDVECAMEALTMLGLEVEAEHAVTPVFHRAAA